MPRNIRPAKSVEEALAAYATAPLVFEAFDGSTLVREHRPGNATPHQLQQSARLSQLRQELQRWATHYSFPLEHVERAAYFTIVSTPETLTSDQMTGLAETILWIYVFDDFLDRCPAVESGAEIDRTLGEILRPLKPELAATIWQSSRRRNLLCEVQRVILQASQTSQRLDLQSRTSPPEPLGLEEALHSLLELVETAYRHSHFHRKERHQYRARLVARQLARCVAAMRREFGWNLRLASSVAERVQVNQINADQTSTALDWMPTFESYLMTGSVSIGMYAVAAVVASFEQDAGEAWRKGWAAIDAAGRIIRLANDLATYSRETEEGKLSSITVMLGELGYPLVGLDPQTSSEIGQVHSIIEESLQQITGFFAYASNRLAGCPVLRFYLEHIVAFALLAYGVVPP